MKHTAKQYAQALYEALESVNPKDTDLVLDNFVQALAANNDAKLFPEIDREFQKLQLAAQGIKQAEVTTATPLDKAGEKAVMDILNKHVKEKIELKQKIDPDLTGGVVISVDDMIIDASVKNSLQELKKRISE